MARTLLPYAVLFLIACGPSGEGTGDSTGGPQPDASGGLGPNAPDASGSSGGSDEGDPDAGQDPFADASHVIGPWCDAGVPSLRLQVADAFQPDSCFAQAGIDSVMVMLHTTSVETGDTVQLGQDGSHAWICPAVGQCEQTETGVVVFESFEPGLGASGIINLDGGVVEGEFFASWCGDDSTCN